MSSPDSMMQERPPTRPCQTWEGHTDWIQGVIHLPDRQRLITCSDDGSLGVWSIQAGKQIANWRDGDRGVKAMALSVDGKKVVSGGDDGVVRLWDIETGQVTAKWMGHTKNIETLYWSRDGERVLSGCRDGSVRVWDVVSGKTVLEIKTGLSDVLAVVYSPDMTKIVTGGFSSEDEPIKIWDASTGKLFVGLKGHKSRVDCLAWTVNGTTLISGSVDASIRTWNAYTWGQIAALTAHTNTVRAIAVSPNGRILASASWDRTTLLLNLDNGQLIGSPLRHPDWVICLSFSTDGNQLTTGCIDNNAYTWDISAIVRDAGMSELLWSPDDDEKALLHANTGEQLENGSQSPGGLANESTHHPIPSSTLPLPRYTPRLPQHGFLERVRFPFFKRQGGQHHSSIELGDRRPAVVDVPLAHDKPTNVSGSQALPSTEPHPAANTTLPAVNTPATSPSGVVILRAGCWIRFLLCFGCLSVQNPNDRH